MCRDGQMIIADIRGWGSLERLGADVAVATMDANGQLIAAAPDLLAELKSALGWLKVLCAYAENSPDYTSDINENNYLQAVENIQSAIAKAEGK